MTDYLPARFQRSRWSKTRRRLHDMAPGEHRFFARSERNNVTSTITRLQEAYSGRRYRTMNAAPRSRTARIYVYRVS